MEPFSTLDKSEMKCASPDECPRLLPSVLTPSSVTEIAYTECLHLKDNFIIAYVSTLQLCEISLVPSVGQMLWSEGECLDSLYYDLCYEFNWKVELG